MQCNNSLLNKKNYWNTRVMLFRFKIIQPYHHNALFLYSLVLKEGFFSNKFFSILFCFLSNRKVWERKIFRRLFPTSYGGCCFVRTIGWIYYRKSNRVSDSSQQMVDLLKIFNLGLFRFVFWFSFEIFIIKAHDWNITQKAQKALNKFNGNNVQCHFFVKTNKI